MLLTYTEQQPLSGTDDAFAFWGGGSVGFVPVPLLITLAILVALAVFLQRTRAGRNLYAIGGNREAAYLAGIAVESLSAPRLRDERTLGRGLGRAARLAAQFRDGAARQRHGPARDLGRVDRRREPARRARHDLRCLPRRACARHADQRHEPARRHTPTPDRRPRADPDRGGRGRRLFAHDRAPPRLAAADPDSTDFRNTSRTSLKEARPWPASSEDRNHVPGNARGHGAAVQPPLPQSRGHAGARALDARCGGRAGRRPRPPAGGLHGRRAAPREHPGRGRAARRPLLHRPWRSRRSGIRCTSSPASTRGRRADLQPLRADRPLRAAGRHLLEAPSDRGRDRQRRDARRAGAASSTPISAGSASRSASTSTGRTSGRGWPTKGAEVVVLDLRL